LSNISAEDGPNKVTTKAVSSCEGDVDVTQRKGKIRTLYDVKLVVDFEGIFTKRLQLMVRDNRKG